MLSLELMLTSHQDESDIDGLTRGQMIFRGKHGVCTSIEGSPDRSMMIFPAITELLDGLRGLLQDQCRKCYTFVGTDSSFQVAFVRMGKGRYAVEAKRRIAEVSEDELVRAVWTGVHRFLDKYFGHLGMNDLVYDDLSCAVDEFESTLAPA